MVNPREPLLRCENGIFALSTGPVAARSAIHVHRVSGPDLYKVLSPCFVLRNTKRSWPSGSSHETLGISRTPVTRYVDFIHPLTGELIDDVVVTFFRGPFSYTGEDVFEISCHGNPLISYQIHDILRQLGLKDAKPGEFTQRAFLNGKCDLLQAEAIQDLIQAETAQAVQLARSSTSGRLSLAIDGLRLRLIEILCYLEAHIDFGQEDVGDFRASEILPNVESLMNALHHLYKSYEDGQKISSGLTVTLCGRPNSGKSSLYNALLEQDLAIVTSIPGTTRDVLREKLLIGQKDFILLDTAGLRESADLVEQMGIERTKTSINNAQLILLCIDGCDLPPEADAAVSGVKCELSNLFSKENQENGQQCILILTKSDLLTEQQLQVCEHVVQTLTQTANTTSRLSTQGRVFDALILNRSNVSPLKSSLERAHENAFASLLSEESVFLSSKRQKSKIGLARDDIGDAMRLLEQGGYPEAIASLVMAAQRNLEELTGTVTLDEVLDSLFSNFCIGK